jgi:hypothetical protein
VASAGGAANGGAGAASQPREKSAETSAGKNLPVVERVTEASSLKTTEKLSREEAKLKEKVEQEKQAVKNKIIFGKSAPDFKPGKERRQAGRRF